MLRSDPAHREVRSSRGLFVLYVEGPRDRDILRIWARRLSPDLARGVESCAVILGGRQPVRAVEHFRRLGGESEAEDAARGLCVLDRDDEPQLDDALLCEPGLEFFTWPRRHIESYLLVPAAIARCLGDRSDALRVTQLLRDHIPELGDEAALERVDAKRLLAQGGPISVAVGRNLRPSRIARAMRVGELHADVRDLLERLRQGLALRAASRKRASLG